MNRLDWLLGALAPKRPPEGAITLPLFWEQWVLTGHILGGDEPLLRPVLGRELGEGGEARVLSPHPRPGRHRASLPPDQVQYELDCVNVSVSRYAQRNIGRSTSIHFIVS